MVEPGPYPELFREHVLRALRHAHERIGPPGAARDAGTRDRAQRALDFALDHPGAWEETASLLRTIAPRFERLGVRSEWLPLLERGLARSRAEGDVTTTTELRVQLAVLYFQAGRYADCRALLAEAIREHERDEASARLAHALNRLAQLARQENQPPEAEALARRALTLADDPLERGFGHMVLGLLAYDARRWEEATEAFERSLNHWRESGDERQLAFGLVNLGTALRGREGYEAAARCYEEAIPLFAGLGDRIHLAVARLNRGVIDYRLGRFDRAIAHYRAAETTFRPLGDPSRLSPLYNNLGMALVALQRYAEAERAYHASLEWLGPEGHRPQRVNVMDNLAICLGAQGDLDGARAVIHQARTLLVELDERQAGHYRAMLEETLAGLPPRAG